MGGGRDEEERKPERRASEEGAESWSGRCPVVFLDLVGLFVSFLSPTNAAIPASSFSPFHFTFVHVRARGDKLWRKKMIRQLKFAHGRFRRCLPRLLLQPFIEEQAAVALALACKATSVLAAISVKKCGGEL